MENYEYEIEELLLKNLGRKFYISDNDILYIYLKIRYIILNPKVEKTILGIKEFDKIEFLKYCFSELYINPIEYKQEQLNFIYGENGLLNIIDNLEFRYDITTITTETLINLDSKTFILNTLSEIRDKNIKYKKNKDEYLYHLLISLNQKFNFKYPKDVKEIHGFKQTNLETQITKELYLKRKLDAKYFKTKDIKSITEDDLEQYLWRNLELIEEGLKGIECQHQIEDGRLDILAEDKNKNIVIIELKISQDERLIWQSLYYPIAMQKEYPLRNIRIITIAPKYKDSLKEVLHTLKQIETFSFKVEICNHKIEKLTLQKEYF